MSLVVFLKGLCWVLFCFWFMLISYIANFAECCCKAFAEDFKLYLSFLRKTCVSTLQGMMRLQKNLDKGYSVARSWDLRLNINKCVVMRFGAYNAGNRMDCNYCIDGKLLEFVTYHRDLDVLVGSKLHFYDHVWKAGGLASELLHSTICHTSVFRVSLFVSHIRPIMDFCSNVWNVGYFGDI